MSMCIALIAHPNYCYYAIVFACMIDLPLNLIIVSNTESVQWENVFNTPCHTHALSIKIAVSKFRVRSPIGYCGSLKYVRVIIKLNSSCCRNLT